MRQGVCRGQFGAPCRCCRHSIASKPPCVEAGDICSTLKEDGRRKLARRLKARNTSRMMSFILRVCESSSLRRWSRLDRLRMSVGSPEASQPVFYYRLLPWEAFFRLLPPRHPAHSLGSNPHRQIFGKTDFSAANFNANLGLLVCSAMPAAAVESNAALYTTWDEEW